MLARKEKLDREHLGVAQINTWSNATACSVHKAYLSSHFVEGAEQPHTGFADSYVFAEGVCFGLIEST